MDKFWIILDIYTAIPILSRFFKRIPDVYNTACPHPHIVENPVPPQIFHTDYTHPGQVIHIYFSIFIEKMLFLL